MSLEHFLEISCGLIFFVNKLLVLIGKKSGWLAGVIAAALSVGYFIILNLWVLVALEVGLIVLMAYGFWKSSERNPTVELCIQSFTVAFMTLLVIVAFNGVLTVTEWLSAFAMIAGTYLLVHGNLRIGWLVYAAGHAFAVYIAWRKQQDFFYHFQIASVLVSLIGAVYPNVRDADQ